MTDTAPRSPVRAIVASFLFTDLVGFSKRPDTEQYAAKTAFSACLRNNLAALREFDYWIKDTGDGAVIAFVSSPEHALYMALAIAEDYGAGLNGLRTGLHLGTVKVTTDVESRPNFVGDGINATKRIMDLAAPGQIAASRSFFEAVSHLDTEYAALFEHVGASDDKHGRAHELFAVAPSAALLQKLRLDLGVPAPMQESREKQATPTGARTGAAPVSAESQAPSSGTTAAARMRFSPVIALMVVVVLAAAIFFATRAPAPATKPLTSTAPDAAPVAAKSSTLPAASVGEAAAPSPTSPTIPQGRDKGAPMETTQAAQDGVAGGLTPAVVAPASTPKSGGDSRPQSAVAPVAPVRASAAPDRASSRCSHIVEKAAIGEPLSADEKRELANSCR